MAEIKVDGDLCDGYGEYPGVCPQDVFELDGGGKAFPPVSEDCEEDRSCVEVYPWVVGVVAGEQSKKEMKIKKMLM